MGEITQYWKKKKKRGNEWEKESENIEKGKWIFGDSEPHGIDCMG